MMGSRENTFLGGGGVEAEFKASCVGLFFLILGKVDKVGGI